MRWAVPSLILGLLGVWLLAAMGPWQGDAVAKQGGRVLAAGEQCETVEFTTDEGTWMSVDISPDGRTIVFDLLGDLHVMPTGGGKSKRLTTGAAFDTQPRFAPDGQSIIFVSDRGGAHGVWTVDAEGRNARRLVLGQHLSPAWSPDGRFFAATRLDGGDADGSADTGGGGQSMDVMLYGRDGDSVAKPGSGAGATFSPDGRHVYFASRGFGSWTRRDNMAVYDRVDERVSEHLGGARPMVSPDGKSLVFGVLYEGRSAFKVQDLTSGEERWLTMGVAPLNDVDRSRDTLPGYAFTPDGRALVTWIDGELWRIDMESGERTAIPFTAEVCSTAGAGARAKGTSIESAPLRARSVRSAHVSPDGSRLIFRALGKLWLQDLPDGVPRRLTDGAVEEYAPAWSPDGRYIAYATWGPQGGEIYRIAPDVPGARSERLTRTTAYYHRLTYTVDGSRLLAYRNPASERLYAVSPRSIGGSELVWLPASGGAHTVIARVVLPASATFVGQPCTTRDPDRVYLTDADEGLVSMRWDGSDRRLVIAGTADDMRLSPDGVHLAVMTADAIAVLPAPDSGETPTIDIADAATLPADTNRLPRHGAEAMAWTADSRTLYYAGGSSLYQYDVRLAVSSTEETIEPATASSGQGRPAAETSTAGFTSREITLAFAPDEASGTVVLRGGRLITMRGDEVIERGDIVIADGRIIDVGRDLPVPPGAHVVDVAGKSILPGYVDPWATFDLLSATPAIQPWEFLASLAYGVTTVRDPRGAVPNVVDYAERIEAGDLLGPRYPATGTAEFPTGPADWTRPLAGPQDGSSIYMGTFPITPMGKDVVHSLAHSRTTYVPGLVRNDVGPWPEDRFIALGRHHDDVKLQRFIPHSILDRETLRRRSWARDEQYLYPSYAMDAARVVSAGGRVAAGTRGGLPGLSMHWELRALYADGKGLAPLEALRAATIAGAQALGLSADLGSLEPGRVADLQVIDGNPLTDLSRTTALTHVMKGGRLHDAATLAEVWPRQRTLPEPWWLEHDPARPMTEPDSLTRYSTQASPDRASPQRNHAPAASVTREFTVTPITEPRPKDPTYALPLVPTRTVRFTTDEGTWVSVDVSPDGKTILFDLLGDLYTVPITGGKATRIMGGMALDTEPRYSPDGTRIAFVSDRSGYDNLWIAHADGGNPRALTHDQGSDHPLRGVTRTMMPVWSPDGRFIIADGKQYDANTGAMVELPGSLDKVAFGGSAAYAYAGYSTLSWGSGIDVYDLHTDRIWRLFTSVREIPGFGFGLTVSPDDRWLVYGTVVDQQPSLRLRDLHTGTERWLARDIDAYPNLAFTPDGAAVVISTGGKLWRIEIPSGRRIPIPFSVDVELDLGPLSQFQYSIPDSSTVRQIREPRLSPDGKRLAFIALDKLYVMEFPAGVPQRATTSSGIVENYPAWSLDGRYVAFSTYSDLEGGHIQRVEVAQVLASRPDENPECLTREPDLYTRLAYTPDGQRLVFGRSPWRRLQQHVERTPELPVDLLWMAADGGRQHYITPVTDNWNAGFEAGAPPQFLTAEPDRIVVPRLGALVAMQWDGSAHRPILTWPAASSILDAVGKHSSVPPQALLSPDGSRALVVHQNNLYVAALPPEQNGPIHLDPDATLPSIPLQRISRSGAEFPRWSTNGERIYFSVGHALFVYDVDTGGDPIRHDVTVVVPRDRPRGTLALRGARLVTMRGDEVIGSGDMVIRDDRILALGPTGEVSIPEDAEIMDVRGATILPGYVDVHAHMRGPYNTHKTQLPQYLACLAYGVTTTRDPSTGTNDWLAYADRVAVGDIVGPRVRGTGPTINPANVEPLTSLEATRNVLRRYAEFYRTETLKQYTAGNRLVRQWIVMASYELGLSPTTEGASNWKMTLTEMLDGYAGHEHEHAVYPIHRDVALLMAASGITYTPTLLVGMSHDLAAGRFKVFRKDEPSEDARLGHFNDHPDLAWRLFDNPLASEVWFAEGEFRYPELARAAAELVHAGGHVGIGAHGELNGLGTHYEMWLLGSGGLSNLEVLRAGTLAGAHSVGLDAELGSLESGKLADLQVLEGNPLEDLENTNTIRYVMKNGRLYDADTLNELWPRTRKLGTQWWQTLDPPEDMKTAAGSSDNP